MKRLMVTFVAVTLALSFNACLSNEDPQATAPATTEAANTAVAAAGKAIQIIYFGSPG